MFGASQFGAPQAADPEEHQSASGAASTSPAGDEAPEIEIDPNDPFLTSQAESMETDAAHDAYAMRPPMPDGKWKAKIRIAKIKNKKGEEVPENYIVAVATWLDKPVPYYAVNLEYEIIDMANPPRYDGFKMTEFWVKTLVNTKLGGSSPLATILRKAGAEVPVKSSQKQVLDLALKYFAGEPEVILETQWIATCQHCEEAAKKAVPKLPNPKPIRRGQRNFDMKPGVSAQTFVKNDPMVNCPTCKQSNRAKAVPQQFFSVREAQPTFR